VRAAVAADADQVFALLEELTDDVLPERSGFDRVFGQFVSAGPQSILLVAEVDSTVRGYVLATVSSLLYTTGASAHLQELVVENSAKGSGIGSKLVEAVERRAAELGADQLTAASRRSAGFFERLGYLATADFVKRTF
jgi:N-acetylglutamate synthase-like GNAT family acetyltransferase